MAKRQRCLWALDNLEGLARVKRNSVALAYLDPPFNSGRDYGAVVSTTRADGKEMQASFSDAWQWTEATESSLGELRQVASKKVAHLLTSLVKSLGPGPLAAYLVVIGARLVAIHRALRNDGSVYVHCDPAASHYLKVILDHVFGPENFRNEIIWKRTHAHSSARRYGSVHDTLLFYSKSSTYTWNPVFSDYKDSYIEKYFRLRDERGRYQLITCTAPGDRDGTRAHYEWKGQLPPAGRHWAWKREQMQAFEEEGRLVHSKNGVPRLKRYSHEGRGVAVQDVWLDINRLDSHSRERVGFETQKPVELLERLITASSNPGDLVLDPFSGSGTTAVAAERLGRSWIAMDNSLMACAIALARVRQEVNLKAITLGGFPEDVASARRLLRTEPAAFGIWGSSMLGTVPDRDGTTSTVVAGTGKLSARTRSYELLSWVPVGGRVEMAIPRSGHRRLSKVGLVLRHNRSATTVQRWLNQELNLSTHVIDLERLVDVGALKRGLSSTLPDVLSAEK